MRTENTKAESKPEMKTKRLGNFNLFITPVGFGAWAIGGSGWEFGWGEQDDKTSIAAIHRALELGVNWIDSAAVYGMGHSEEVVVGARSAEQVEKNLGAAELNLTDEEIAEIEGRNTYQPELVTPA
jgi:aryl-alcohol dehydrogenase-like predicted oxidoreductase